MKKIEFQAYVAMKSDGDLIKVTAPAISPGRPSQVSFPALFATEWAHTIGCAGNLEMHLGPQTLLLAKVIIEVEDE